MLKKNKTEFLTNKKDNKNLWTREKESVEIFSPSHFFLSHFCVLNLSSHVFLAFRLSSPVLSPHLLTQKMFQIFPPPPFCLTTRKWPRSHFSIYILNLSNADYLPINSTLILSLSLDSDHETTRLRYQGLWAPNNNRQPLRSHHDPVPGSHCTLVQSTLPVTITVPSYWYYRYTYQPHARQLSYQSDPAHLIQYIDQPKGNTVQIKTQRLKIPEGEVTNPG